ncbi:MAG: TIGR03936 family radical SAM-associated protein [Anaerolineae bacterium]|nr:TIGR03936 family radical SAM-associated protein [Anaerolineae bacterium]
MSASPPPPRQRLRVVFGKRGPLVYTGNLDTLRTWERVLRRARLPLAYSHGFNPRPRLQLADALPLGISSEAELIDVWLKEPVALDGLEARLEAVAPAGLAVYSVAETALDGPALPTLVVAADYVIAVEGVSAADLGARVRDFLARARVERTRRDKTYDLRPLVHALSVTPAGALRATLSLGEAGTARPDELLDALGLSDAPAMVHRVRLHLRS